MSLKDWAIEILEGIILINDWHGKAQLIEGGSIPGWWFWVSKEIRLSEPGRPCQEAALFHGLLLSSCLYVPVLTNLSDAQWCGSASKMNPTSPSCFWLCFHFSSRTLTKLTTPKANVIEIKVLEKTGIEGTHLNRMKTIYRKPIVTRILNGEKFIYFH